MEVMGKVIMVITKSIGMMVMMEVIGKVMIMV